MLLGRGRRGTEKKEEQWEPKSRRTSILGNQAGRRTLAGITKSQN